MEWNLSNIVQYCVANFPTMFTGCDIDIRLVTNSFARNLHEENIYISFHVIFILMFLGFQSCVCSMNCQFTLVSAYTNLQYTKKIIKNWSVNTWPVDIRRHTTNHYALVCLTVAQSKRKKNMKYHGETQCVCVLVAFDETVREKPRGFIYYTCLTYSRMKEKTIYDRQFFSIIFLLLLLLLQNRPSKLTFRF